MGSKRSGIRSKNAQASPTCLALSRFRRNPAISAFPTSHGTDPGANSTAPSVRAISAGRSGSPSNTASKADVSTTSSTAVDFMYNCTISPLAPRSQEEECCGFAKGSYKFQGPAERYPAGPLSELGSSDVSRQSVACVNAEGVREPTAELPDARRTGDRGGRRMAGSRRAASQRRYPRRGFLTTASRGVIAAGTLFTSGAVTRPSTAAPPAVNIGGLYPVTGGLGQIGQGCVNAARLAVQMVNDGGGIKALGGARLNLILSDVQSDPTVVRTEADRLITSYKLSAIHGCYASALTLIASEVAERGKVPLLTGSST